MSNTCHVHTKSAPHDHKLEVAVLARTVCDLCFALGNFNTEPKWLSELELAFEDLNFERRAVSYESAKAKRVPVLK